MHSPSIWSHAYSLYGLTSEASALIAAIPIFTLLLLLGVLRKPAWLAGPAGPAVRFPFFSPLLGFLGVLLTGSDTSSNALFGNLQVVTAGRLGLNPVLLAAANFAGGVMGKMISLQTIAVAAAATGLIVRE